LPANVLGFDPRDGYWIRVQIEADVVFSEELELENFPFDCQDFTMSFELSQLPNDEADLLPLCRAGSFLTLDRQFSVATEWHLKRIVSEFRYTDSKQSKTNKQYAVLDVRIKASRVWSSYASSFAITCMMFILGLGAFALNPETDLGNRMQYCVVFLLADVSTLQLVSERLPKIQYMTFLGSYTCLGFSFLFLVTIWSCILSVIPGAQEADKWGFWFFVGLFLLSQMLCLIYARWLYQWERQKLDKTAMKLKKWIEHKTCGCCCLRNKSEGVISVPWHYRELTKRKYETENTEKTSIVLLSVEGHKQRRKYFGFI